MKTLPMVPILGIIAAAGNADAFTFRSRFIERVGNNDIVLANNRIDATNGEVRNIRIQFGVFDDANGPAPEGGFVGWNVGSLEVSGPRNDSNERRNPGRLSPFNFASGVNANGNPPLPSGDPFTLLEEIDATLGTQSPAWVCDAQGNIPPQPTAQVRGRNTFISVFAFSIDPNAGANSYHVVAFGNLIAATSWLSVGNPTSPDCGDPADPSDDASGSVTYAPFPTTPQPFASVLFVDIVPAPGAFTLFGIGGFFMTRRGRRANKYCCLPQSEK